MKPLALIILDGWGHREEKDHNAIAKAKTPFFDMLWKKYPHTLIDASAEAVGLPSGVIGNSEIGHMTMGAGKIIDVDLVRINKAAKAGGFNTNPAFTTLFNHVKKNNSTLHVMGLISPGGVHSHQEHLHEFLKAAKSEGIKQVVVHAFTDGRDVLPKSGAEYLKTLEDVIQKEGIGHIATVSGRLYAMDRDKNWHRTKKAEEAIFECKGKICKARKPSDVIKELYDAGQIDELLEPMVFLDDTGKGYKIEKNDGVLFFNYRPDRARQISKKILDRKQSHNLCFVTMTEYDKSFDTLVAFPPQKPEITLAAVISAHGLKQAHIAETEKYAHVTYFFNGGREEPHEGEEHIMVESRKDVHTHDEAPEMRAREIADKAIKKIDGGIDFMVINFANADMVGHTANVPAIITAVETIDIELKRVVEKIVGMDGMALITADHGNAEKNFDVESDSKHSAHTLNKVPFILINNNKILLPEPVEEQNFAGDEFDPSTSLRDQNLRITGTLADIAPTILHLMYIKQPSQMTGRSLVP
ncbi:MAG: 2,3-bisphosphoglycerate-independent phosphoglycerate mutase [Candidatus Doudnabacteria bacterium CG10_big_fil_rev_8_21_14_0_10_42_18]|uniref:2,3-bisphosphoglycerate-independent phosphoglycerate mutase n=1 Tax=Candidatus Doudnabacteria bacterium CG10_big_fil_rev_8_21_14_0_10_42_18 TaxID=1974552 RepID=A0A2H0VAG6_9BACT|nr:MAG: 2,3-bisphosphoglycerate-independent phosphoglycerate mutase [Candidatus Doudnabacteria bacterium CG10_big_fil_rev_8_21_14_0_10_42_18]